jgi:Zn-dependent peptidase ImmA (M78 family)
MTIPMDKLDLLKKSMVLRRRLGADASGPVDIFPLILTSAAYSEHLTLVLYPMSRTLSGMCVKGIDNTVIAINSTTSVGRQHFSLAHELFHMYFDNSSSTAVCSSRIGTGSEIEKEADQFASFFLVPPDGLDKEIVQMKKQPGDRLTVRDVAELEQYFGVSRQAMLFRLIEDSRLTSEEAAAMRHDVIGSAQRMGYDISLYRPLPPEKQRMTFGSYIQQADEVLKRELVSSGKYEELLLEAFRPDLVYGDDSAASEPAD